MTQGSLTIEAGNARRTIDIAELWRFREVVYFLIWRDFKVRYRQTLLGVAWALIQPILICAVFTLIFTRIGNVPTRGVAYPVFVLAGLVPWHFFAFGVSAATSGMIINKDLVRQIFFPRAAIPLAAVLSGIGDLVIGLLLLVAAMIAFGVVPGIAVLALPLFILLGIVVTFAVGLILCGANVLYRDVGYIVPFALQLALFVSPIAYPSDVLPESWRLFYSLNPMVGVVDGMRWCLFGTPIAMLPFLISLGTTAVLLLLGTVFFRRVERILVDVL